MKKNRRMIKGMAVTIAVVFGITTIDASTGIAKTYADAATEAGYDITTDNGKKTDYVVVTTDDAAYHYLKKSAKENEVYDQTNNKKLENNQVMVLELTKKEAIQVEEMKGVESLEKDTRITANEEVAIDQKAVEQAVRTKQEMDLNQWNLEAVNMPDDQLVADTASGSAVKVAVMDSGITPLSGIGIAGTVDFANLGEDNVNENPLFDDPSGHGTGIAGMIAAKGKDSVLKGIAKDAQIYSVKVLDTQNQSTISKIVSGIYWCIDHNIDVINMSFGTAKYSETLKKAVEDASAAGIIMVASAGNRGEEAETMDYPAAYPEVLSVGAVNGEKQICGFTSKKEDADIFAPGEKVWTQGVFQGLTAVDGTSIATAHVTGAVALLLQAYPKAESNWIRQLLMSSSVQIDGEENAGVLDITEALKAGNCFTAKEQEDVVPRQVEETETFDTDNIVTGCWSNQDHGNTVGANGANTTYIRAAKIASCVDTKYPSRDDGGDMRGNPFHGRHNYIANLNYLYTVALRLKNYGSKNINSAQIATALDVNVKHQSDKSYGASDINGMKSVLLEALKDTNLKKQCGATQMDDLAWMTLGFAIHLAGDMYAHRTILPKDSWEIYYGTSKGLKDKDCPAFSVVDYKMGNSVIEFRDIKCYMEKGLSNSYKCQSYEDNTNFYSTRYNAAKSTVGNLLTHLNDKKNFSVNSVIIKNLNLDYEVKLNNFEGYLKSAGYSSTAETLKRSSNKYRVNLVNKSNPTSSDKNDYKTICINEQDYVDYDYAIC